MTSLTLHTLKPAKGARTKSFRIGRGYASGRGTTAGRGTKGQRARTGGRNRLKLKGMKQMLLAFPKQRGFKSKYPTVYAVRVEPVMKAFAAGAIVDLSGLKKKELIPNTAVLAKIIAGGKVDKALSFVGILATASVKEAVTKAGGSFKTESKKKNKNKTKKK